MAAMMVSFAFRTFPAERRRDSNAVGSVESDRTDVRSADPTSTAPLSAALACCHARVAAPDVNHLVSCSELLAHRPANRTARPVSVSR
jgi:hypothetical protein